MRWEGYDYASGGMYAVTIVTRDRRHVLGTIIDEVMSTSAAGSVIQETWFGLPARFPTVGLDAFVVMPNHIHGIIVMNESATAEHDSPKKGRASPAPTSRGDEHEHGDVLEGDDVAFGRETVGAGLALPLPGPTTTQQSRPTLGNVVGVYKSLSAIVANRVLGTTGQSFWQRGYHDRVIRGDGELEQFRWYIERNPVAWHLDREYAPVYGS